MKDICMYCASQYKKRDFRQKFCSINCREEYKSEIRRNERLLNDEGAKSRVFSDLTITLVASAIIKGDNLGAIVKMCNWDENRFYQQLKEHKNKIEARKKIIISRSLKCG